MGDFSSFELIYIKNNKKGVKVVFCARLMLHKRDVGFFAWISLYRFIFEVFLRKDCCKISS